MQEQFYPTEDGNLIRFKSLQVLSKNGTAANNGQDTFDREIVAVVVSPGLTKSEAVIPVHRKYWDGSERFHRGHKQYQAQFEAWQRGMEAGTFGTPIDAWVEASPAEKDRLKGHKIATVETLAAVPDAAIASLGMGARDLVRKAQKYVDRGGARAVDEVRTENENLRRILQDALERIDALETGGPPPKQRRARVAEVAQAQAGDAPHGA